MKSVNQAKQSFEQGPLVNGLHGWDGGVNLLEIVGLLLKDGYFTFSQRRLFYVSHQMNAFLKNGGNVHVNLNVVNWELTYNQISRGVRTGYIQ